MRALVDALLGQSHQFVHSICDPDAIKWDFTGDLGKYTPCFIDIGCLAVGHGVAIILYISWLYRLLSTRNRLYDTYRLQGWYRAVHYTCLAAAAAAAAIPLFQLNARLAQQSLPLSDGAIAPHEWLGLLLAAVSFLLLSIILLLELQHSLVMRGRWLLRLPLLLVGSSELVKLRFVLQLEVQQQERLGYFFWLYVTYVCLQGYLAAVLCVMHRDPKSPNLLLEHEGEVPYMPLRSQAESGAGAAAAGMCPEYTAGLLSIFTFSWLNPLMKKGYKTPLTATDIWMLPPPDRVETLEHRFRTTWDRQLSTRGMKSASLFAACWAAVGHLFLAALPFKLVIDASQFVGPTILNRLLSVVAGRSTKAAGGWDGLWEHPLENGYVLAGLLFVGQLAGVLADHQHFQRVQRAGFRLKAVVTAEVYRKVLLLAPSERSHLSAGRLYNLVSSDANTLSDFCGNAFGFMSAPLRIIITMVLLYRELGFASMIAIVCIAAAVPINSKLVRAAANKLQTALKHSDARAKLESEMVAGIEVVKASTWEPAFKDRINAARAQELSVLYAVSMLQTLMGVLVMAIPTLIPVVTFLAYLLIMKQPLSAAQAFTALSLFNILRFPLFQLPTIVSQATQARVALTRLRELLAASEVQQTTLRPTAAAAAKPAAAAAAAVGSSVGPNGLAAPTPFAAVQRGDSFSSSGSSSSKPSQQQQQQQCAGDADVAISLHGDFSWDPDTPPTLTDLDLVINKGQLVAVVGPTGSGKTSLISAMLGLLLGVSSGNDPDSSLYNKPQQDTSQAVSGQSVAGFRGSKQVSVIGRTAYVPQTPFILGASVRDNILFGREWDAGKYAAATAAAQLLPDFAALPGGDLTELGDRGQNVSGGQKQRIAIARALYADADVVLLDDPLSALDAKVGRAVAEQALRKELAAKTVVLATNQLQFVSMADLVVVMREGAAAEVGTYQELLAAGGVFTALMKEAQAEDDLSSDSSSGDESVAPAAAPADSDTSTAAAAAKPGAAPAAPIAAAPAAAAASSSSGTGKLTTDEASAVGGVSWAVVSAYFKALGGPVAVLLLMFGFLTTELLRVGATVWLSIWTGETEAGSEQHSSQFYMGIYAAISGGQLLLLYLNSLNVAASGIRAGRVMHEGLLSSLLRAPMSFFHTTPSGRIINRLTKDTADIDRNLASTLSFAFRAFLQLCSTITLIAVGAPFALPALVVMLGIFWALYGYFMASMRQAKRLEAVSRSPVLSSVNEAIAGSATIRAFGIEAWLLNRQKTLVNTNAANSLLTQSLNRWLSVRLEGLGALCTLMAALVTVEQQGGSAAAMGLLLTYALQITMSTNMTLRAGSMAEQTFNAVERVDEYCHLPAEAVYDQSDHDNKNNKNNSHNGHNGSNGDHGSSGKKKREAGSGLREPLLPISHDGSSAAAAAAASHNGAAAAVFGSRGEIEFRDVNMRYRPGLPLVLCGLSFKVDAGFKVGVVGRTGAGKSSLIGALFRLTEIESGCISIDGVNTKTLGLRKLRSSMALIPQVPVIFAGSIRENLAPFGGHSDAALWSALRRSHLAPVVEKWESDGLGGLDYVLGEGGSPLSAGQKQLLALARALLNPAKILVLDEATANVDVETDALIQETLRTEFSERTLVAVAHRLHTIIEADRVLVMEKGKAVEYGAPAQLLEDQQGHFTGMVRETGDATEKFLRSMAAGDISAHRELQDAAAAALANICLPCDTDSPACFNTLASQLTNGASTVNHQLSGLLHLLQTSDLVPRCGAAAAAVAGSTKQDRAAVLQQLKAALAATSQLQRLALQAQELLAAAAVTPDGGSSTEEGRRGILASVSEQLEQASLTGSTDETPFAPNISQLLVGSAPGTGFVMTPRRMQAVTSMPVRRFSHDDATWGLRPAATTGAGFNNRRAQTSSGGGRGLDGGSGARILRETLSFPANSSSSTGAGMPGSSSVGDGTYQRPLPRQRSIMARLSLDVPAAALAAAAAAARGGGRDGSSSSSTQGV